MPAPPLETLLRKLTVRGTEKPDPSILYGALASSGIDGAPRPSRIYRRFVDAVLRDAADDELAETLGADLATVSRGALRRLALADVEAEEVLRKRAVNGIVTEYLRSQWPRKGRRDATSARQLLAHLASATRLFTFGRQGLRWAHWSLAGYLAAEKLAEIDPSSGKAWTVVRRWRKPGWHDPLLFLLDIWSESHDLTPLLERVLRGKSREPVTFIAAALARGVAVDTGLEKRVLRVIRTKADRYTGGHYGVQLLSYGAPGMDPSRARNLLRLLEWRPLGRRYTDQHCESLVRKAIRFAGSSAGEGYNTQATRALREMGRAPELGNLATNSSLPADLRVRAAIDLGLLGETDQASDALLSLLTRSLANGGPDETAAAIAVDALKAWDRLSELKRLTSRPVPRTTRTLAAEALSSSSKPWIR